LAALPDSVLDNFLAALPKPPGAIGAAGAALLNEMESTLVFGLAVPPNIPESTSDVDWGAEPNKPLRLPEPVLSFD
jgi:hypothetical protein